MNILATLRRTGGINALARQLDESPIIVTAAVDALLPVVIEEFQQFSGGTAALLDLIETAGGGLMAQSIMNQGPVDIRAGIMIMAQFRRLEPVSQTSAGPIDFALRERLLPLLVMLVGGYLAARSSSGGMSVNELSSLLDARRAYFSSGEESV